MNATIGDVMHTPVMTITKHQTLGHARKLMRAKEVSALPVVGPDDEPLGIITATDLLDGHGHPDNAPVSIIMATDPYAVGQQDGPHLAARVMRNHHLHHLVVTEQHKVVGMLSTFDLLRLVEDHRYVAKGAPTPSKKRPNRS